MPPLAIFDRNTTEGLIVSDAFAHGSADDILSGTTLDNGLGGSGSRTWSGGGWLTPGSVYYLPGDQGPGVAFDRSHIDIDPRVATYVRAKNTVSPITAGERWGLFLSAHTAISGVPGHIMLTCDGVGSTVKTIRLSKWVQGVTSVEVVLDTYTSAVSEFDDLLTLELVVLNEGIVRGWVIDSGGRTFVCEAQPDIAVTASAGTISRVGPCVVHNETTSLARLDNFVVGSYGDRRLAVLDDDLSVYNLTALDLEWHWWFPQVSSTRAAWIGTRPGFHDPPDYGQTSLWVQDFNGVSLTGSPTQIIDQAAEGWVFLATPHWSPDGAQLVVARAPAGGRPRPTVLDPDDGTVIGDVDADAAENLTDPSWHPDPDVGGAGIARLIYCRAGSLVRRDWDGAAPVGARTTVFDRTTWDTGDPGTVNPYCYDPIYSPDGTAVYFLAEFAGQGNGDWGIGACLADGTAPWRVTPDDHIYSKPEITADGLTAYTHRFNGNWELVAIPTDGTAVATPALVDVLYDDGAYSEYPVPLGEPPENTPPVADSQTVSVPVDTPTVITLTGSDLDGDPLTFTVDTPPTDGALDDLTPPNVSATTADVTYTPDPGYTGPDAFTFHVNDGEDDSALATVDINVVYSSPPDGDGEGEDEPPRIWAPFSPCGDPPRIVAPSGPLGPASPCAETRVGIWRRGQSGAVVWLDSTLRQIDGYEWGRARSATTTAKVTVPLAGTVDSACCQLLADLEPWRDELRIFRDMDEVWRGPLVVTRETRTAIVLEARDVTAWAERRRVHSRFDFVAYDAAQAWARVWGDALRGAWPDGLRLRVSDCCADVTRTIDPYPYLAAVGPLGEIAANAVDWTAIGGELLVGGVCTNVLLDVTLYDDAFAGSPEVAKDGLAYAGWVGVNGESDVVAEAGDPDSLVEMVVDDQGARDVLTARVRADQEWAVRGRGGVPRIVTMAADMALSPHAPIGVNDLVPGRMVRLSIQPACTPVVALMRLVALTVSGDADGEKIVPTFEPVGDAGGRNG